MASKIDQMMASYREVFEVYKTFQAEHERLESEYSKGYYEAEVGPHKNIWNDAATAANSARLDAADAARAAVAAVLNRLGDAINEAEGRHDVEGAEMVVYQNWT
jgi:hypothetical protein